MTGMYTQEKIENWVADFCGSDSLLPFSSGMRAVASAILVRFLAAACAMRGVEPEEIEESDAAAAFRGEVAKLNVAEELRGEVPELCGNFLAWLEDEGRVGGGRLMGAAIRAMRGSYLEAASDKVKPIVRAGSKLGRNDPCPCGSGRKYKKCCMNE